MASGAEVGEEVQGYRPLCGLAIVGLVLSLMSGFAFFGPVLWSVAVVAVIVNVIALRRIAAESPRLGGRRAAVAGLALALFLGGAAAAYNVGASSVESASAHYVIEQFVGELRKGNVARAHQLMLELDERKGSGDLDKFYQRDASLKKQLDGLRIQPTVAILLDPSKRAAIHWHSMGDPSTNTQTQFVVEIYKLTYDESGKRESKLIKLHVRRSKSLAHQPHAWVINGIEELLPL